MSSPTLVISNIQPRRLASSRAVSSLPWPRVVRKSYRCWWPVSITDTLLLIYLLYTRATQVLPVAATNYSRVRVPTCGRYGSHKTPKAPTETLCNPPCSELIHVLRMRMRLNGFWCFRTPLSFLGLIQIWRYRATATGGCSRWLVCTESKLKIITIKFLLPFRISFVNN